MFSLIHAWINGWVDNREAGGLRRHRAYYAITVMEVCFPSSLRHYIDGLVQNCSNSSALIMKLLQCGTKPSISCYHFSLELIFIRTNTKYERRKYKTWFTFPNELHVCSNHSWVSIGSGNGLLPVRRLAINWTNVGLLSFRLLGTNFSEIRIGIISSSFKKMYLKLSSAKMAVIFCQGEIS